MRALRIIIAGGKITSTLQLHALLDRLGYDAIITENGSQTLELLEAKPAKLIIFDAHLPARDVISTQEQIAQHKQWNNIPLIMMAAKHCKTAHDEYFPFGYENLLTTPFDLNQLHTLMQEFLATGSTKKRQYPRIHFKRTVTVTYRGNIRDYLALNLSEGGIYLKAERPLPVGTSLDLTLPLPEQRPLNLVGLVIHQKGSRLEVLKAALGMAVKFQKSDKAAATALSSYIAEELKQGFPSGNDAIMV